MQTDSYLQAELVSTGAELLSGRSTNTHARVLGDELGRIGIVLARDTTVPDDVDVIRAAVQDALNRVDWVFVSGGLGPTSDDVTRDAVAGLLGRKMVMDGASLELLRQRMRQRGRETNPARERQALIVEGAVALSNAVGAAPGERIEHNGKTLFLLPGPPPELCAVLDDHVLPWLIERLGNKGAIRERVLSVHGLAEADMVQRFEAAHFPPPELDAAYCMAPGGVEVRLYPSDETDDEQLNCAADWAAELLGDHVYARERIALESLVGRLLTERKQTVATAESCTGGLIGARITSVHGSSAYYVGGVIAYADAVKFRELGVVRSDLEQEGAVSEMVARQMAVGVRDRFGADYGVAVTGIAGPSGGTEEKPVGLVYLAVAHGGGTEVRRHIFSGNRQTIREMTCITALHVLRSLLV